MGSPTPGLQGDYSGTCVVCMTPTDTGLRFEGPAEYAMAGLIHLGVPEDEATGMVSIATGSQPGTVPAEDRGYVIRLCQSDADDYELEVGLLVSDNPIPTYRPA